MTKPVCAINCVLPVCGNHSNTFGFESFLECVVAFSATIAATTTWWQNLVGRRSVAAELALVSPEWSWTVQMTLDPVSTRKDPQVHWNHHCRQKRGLLVSVVFACRWEVGFLDILQETTWSASSPRACIVTECFQDGIGPVSVFNWYCQKSVCMLNGCQSAWGFQLVLRSYLMLL